MSEADKMFEELGYKKIENHQEKTEPKENEWTTQDNPYIEYTGELIEDNTHYSMFIRFMTDARLVQLGGYESGTTPYGKNYCVMRNPILNMKDIQAINKKCEELGWI